MHQTKNAILAAMLLTSIADEARSQYVSTPNGPAPWQQLTQGGRHPGFSGPYGLHQPKVIPNYGPDYFLRPDLGDLASLFYTPAQPKHRGFGGRRVGYPHPLQNPDHSDPAYLRRPSNLGFIPVRRGHGYGTGVYRHPNDLVRILGKGL
ncbi:hypothetical protein BH23PLA1_BH23PLA1_23500 [soil metagenome]